MVNKGRSSEVTRIDTLERTTDELAVRLARLEQRMGIEPAPAPAPWPAPSDPVQERGVVDAEAAKAVAARGGRGEGGDGGGLGWTSVASATARHVARTPLPHAPAPTPPAPAAAPASTRPGLEDLLGGRVLAWTGGIVVLVGILLLVAIGVSRGWIGEGLRTTLGALASFSLVAAGAWLHERKGQTEAALASAAAGIAGLFAVVTVASRVYDLVPAFAGAWLAFGVGALGVVLALRWSAQGIAALGLLGGLAAPLLVGAPADPATAALLFAGAACASVVCVRRRWDRLALAAFALATVQWTSGDVTLLMLIAFGALTAATAVAMIGRTGRERAVPVVLLAANAFVLVAAGWPALDHGTLWLTGLAAAHAALAAPLIRTRHPLGVPAASLAVAVADLTLLTLLDGPALAAAWAATAVAFALLVRHLAAAGKLERGAAETGLGAHVGLALLQTLVAGGGTPETPALVVLAIACFTSALVLSDRPAWRTGLHVLALATVAGLTALHLDGAALACAYAAEAAALAQLTRRLDDPLAGCASLAMLALATGVALLVAPPAALLDGLADPAAALGALAAVAFAAWRCLGPVAVGPIALYAASTALVTACGAGEGAQTALSALWGLTGVALLVGGLRIDRQALRTAGLALLGVALAKALLHDLTELDAFARVGSLLAVGLLLLAGGYAWQRIRGGSLGTQNPR